MAGLREADVKIDFFQDEEFEKFHKTLDSEMKRIRSIGDGTRKGQAEIITPEEEERLWTTGTLGDHSPWSLLNAIFYMTGMYFALRSGQEHRQLRHKPCQIEVVEKPGQQPYLLYVEDVSKNHQFGLRGRKILPKFVKHYANTDNPNRCFVRLFKFYNSVCPPDRPDNAFYLKPLSSATNGCWFSRQPMGHNLLSNMVHKMCLRAGVSGYKTNHSLRATTASRLYHEGVDEQLIMERTGHHSIDGIRSYKRTSTEQVMCLSDILNNPTSNGNKIKKSSESDSQYDLSKLQFSGCSNISIIINNNH